MKLLSFVAGGARRFGALATGLDRVIDFASVRAARASELSAPRSLLELIEQGQAGLTEAHADLVWAAETSAEQATFPLSSVRLLAPTGMPIKLLCFSVYEDHMKRALAAFLKLKLGPAGRLLTASGLVKVPRAFYQRPFYYKGNHVAYSGPDDEILRPAVTAMLDYEMELGVVLGAGGINIAPEDAMSKVFGYTIFNDFSARDLLSDEIASRRGPLKGKDFATSNAIGPWVVTKDEIPDPHNLALLARVNGEIAGAANTSQMTHRIEAQIAEASRHEPVLAGEFIGTGCAPGGCGFEQLRFLAPGDQVEIEIEKIGVLRNRISKSAC